MAYITIVKGDDTDFLDNQYLVVKFNTDINMAGFKAIFTLDNIELNYPDLSAKYIEIILSNEVTSKLKTGKMYGTLKLIDTEDRIRTVTTVIPFNVITKVMNNSVQVSDQSIQIDVSINKNEFNVDMSIVGLSKTVAEGYLAKMQQYDSTLTSIADNVSELNANVNEKALQAAASASLAEQWASSGVLVDGTDYSAKYYAESAANSAQDAAQSVTSIEELELSNQDLSNLSSEGQGILDSKLNQTQITNCVLEVPQRIKYTFENGTFTLKAGSVVIVPYGTTDQSNTYPIGAAFLNNNFKVYDTQYTSGNFFVWAEIQADISISIAGNATTKESFLFCSVSTNNFGFYNVTTCYAQSTQPETGQLWYDTVNNVFKDIQDTPYIANFSFPIVLFSRESGIITNILQVYNGYGYIGNTLWIDKGIKGLSPNGRNADGTLNNTEVISSNINVFQLSTSAITRYEFISPNGYRNEGLYYIQNKQPDIGSMTYATWLNPETNILMVTNDGGTSWSKVTMALACIVTSDGTRATEICASTPVQLAKSVDLYWKAEIDLSNCTKPYVTETYVNGSSWYRVWSDGWCEQGGVTTLGVNQTTTVTLIKTYINTNYAILVNFKQNVNIDDNPMPYVSTTSQFKIYGTNMGSHDSWSNVAVQWVTTGYIS